LTRSGRDDYNPASIFPKGSVTMKLKKILLFALGVAAVVAGLLALTKRKR